MRNTIKTIAANKGANQTPLVCLTAYTAPTAKIFDMACDILLVGDSVAMVVYGEPSTLQADMAMMIRHGRAVQNATTKALVVIDMPFGSYQESKEEAFRNAAILMKETGAASVKLEGGVEMAETIAYLSERGIPVMGHIGLQPQSMNAIGGFRTQGRDEETAQKIMNDAKAVAQAGAFAIVIEGVPESLAAEITRAVPCPTIGIGASSQCDGQILVAEDMLGITAGPHPKFVKTYATLAKTIGEAVETYARDVRSRSFPGTAQVYGAATPQQSSSQPMNTQVESSLQPVPKLELELEDLPEEPENCSSSGFSLGTVLRATRR